MSKIRTPVHDSNKVGTYDGPLAFEDEIKDPDYVYRWVNVRGYNVDKKRSKGWELIPIAEADVIKSHLDSQAIRDRLSSDGTYVCRIVDNDNGMKAYLMRMSKQRHAALVAEKDRVVDQREKDLGLRFKKENTLSSELTIQKKEDN